MPDDAAATPAAAPVRVAPLVGPRRPLVGPRRRPGLVVRLLAGRRVVALGPRLLGPAAALLTAGVLAVGLLSDRPDVDPVDGLPAADPGRGTMPAPDGPALPEPMVRPTAASPSGADARVDPTTPVRPSTAGSTTTQTPTGSSTATTAGPTGTPTGTATLSATPTDITGTEPTASATAPTPITAEPTEPTGTAPAGVTVVIELPLPVLED